MITTRSITPLLDSLTTSGLIRLAQTEPEQEYVFKHALVRDAAYSSLLKQERRELHRAAGEAIEQASRARLDDVAPILGMHFDEAGEYARARHFYSVAAENAARRFANAEAIMLYDHALDVALRGNEYDATVTRLFLRRGRLLELSGRYAEALASYEQCEQLSCERNSQSMELEALLACATVYVAPTSLFNPTRGDEVLQRALALALRLGDRAAECKAHWLMLLLFKFTRQMERAVETGDHAIAIARELGLREQLAFILNDIYPAYLTTGHMTEGIAAMSEAERLWRELDNLPLLVDTLNNMANNERLTGRLGRAEEQVREARDISLRIENPWGQSYSASILGAVLLEKAEYGAAISAHDEAHRLGAQAGFAISQILTRAMQSHAFLELGSLDRAEAAAQDGLYAAERLLPDWRGSPIALLALCAVRSGDLNAASRAVARALEVASLYDLSLMYARMGDMELHLLRRDHVTVLAMCNQNQGMLEQFGLRLYLPDVLLARAQALMGMAVFDEAVRALGEASDMLTSIGARRPLWRILVARAECEAQLGNRVEADEMRRQAREAIAYVADHAPADLRETFLAMPDVRAAIR
jgi:tetratricopeptide (TPR) repeat protein